VIKAGVVTFPGSNCDDDCIYALGSVAGFHVSKIWHKEPSLGDFNLVILPGGFSYGDYLRTGAIASVSPIMTAVKDYAERGGWVLGICNGFQILCEAGLLPGALIKNSTQNFICKDVNLEVVQRGPWAANLPTGSSLSLPIAHGEGRYVVNANELVEMKKNDQIVFRYQNDVNGSLERIAGVTNLKKNVCGMMPHPERATDLKSKEGLKIWKALSDSLLGVA
jgi:phosphoribosylformylglycinamidine synthase